jgi:hypothetical protein
VCIITRVEDESILPTKTKETLRELENFPVVILNLYTPKSKHGMNGSSSDKKIIVRMVESRDAIELLPGKSFPDLNPDATVNWHGHSGKKYYIDARYLKKIGKLKNK